MTVESVLGLFAQAMMTVLYVIGPALAAGMATGLFIAVFQATTQIQETSLTFVPKVAAVGITLLFTGRWSLGHLMGFFREVIQKFEGAGL